MRDYRVKEVLGTDIKETPETLAFDLSMQFSAEVLHEAERQDVTLAELARRMGVKQPTLCEMLKGANLTVKTMARMALALGCDIVQPRLAPPEKLVESRLQGGADGMSKVALRAEAAQA